MWNSSANDALARYPHLTGPLTPVAGGFSGANLWRVGEDAYLRAWPEGEDPARLRWIHGLLRGVRLPFVPVVFPARDGSTLVEVAGRCWEAGTWLPGVADYHAHPSPARLANACRALAQVHVAWQPPGAPVALVPGVQRRLTALAEATLPALPDDPLDVALPAARRAVVLAVRWLPAVSGWLAPWANVALPLQPCLLDPWHDHVLYTGDAVTGLIDYGAVAVDHPAVDLARLLGSLSEDDAAGWQAGLAAYCEITPLPHPELCRDLDRSGVVLALVRWLQRLYGPQHFGGERRAAAQRLARLAQRLANWEAPLTSTLSTQGTPA